MSLLAALALLGAAWAVLGAMFVGLGLAFQRALTLSGCLARSIPPGPFTSSWLG